MNKRIKLLHEHSDYDIYDVQIDLKYTGEKSFFNPILNAKVVKQSKIIIDRLKPDAIYSTAGSIALYFKNAGVTTSSLNHLYDENGIPVLTDSYWKHRTPDFKLVHYADYKNNIYLNSFDKPTV